MPQLIHYRPMQALTEKLLSIEYMDVAEQAISALEKTALYYPQPILACGAMGALLCFLDFFPLSVQRQALRTVANICGAPLRPTSSAMAATASSSSMGGGGRRVGSSSTVPDVSTFESPFLDAAPALTQLLNHHEGSIVEYAALALLRILQCFVEASGTRSFFLSFSYPSPHSFVFPPILPSNQSIREAC